MDPWVFTMDLEWSPPGVVREALEVFDRRGIRCTLFLTNDLGDFDFGDHELALHPNCVDLSDMGGPVDHLLRVAPEAKGVRWHALFGSQRLYDLYETRGIRYESNIMMQDQVGIRPYRLTRRVWEVPIFFMDNMHLLMAGDRVADFTPESLALDGPGLRVFDFHPVHITLNTEHMDRYRDAKKDYHDPARLRAQANPSKETGSRVLLERLLDQVEAEGLATRTVLEVVEAAEAGT